MRKRVLLSGILLLLLTNFTISHAAGAEIVVPGFSYISEYDSTDLTNLYRFDNDLSLSFRADTNISLEINYDPVLSHRYFGVELFSEAKTNITINITSKAEFTPLEIPTTDDYGKAFSIDSVYGSYFEILLNDEITKITVSTMIAEQFGLDPSKKEGYFWVIFDEEAQVWRFLKSTIIDDSISTDLDEKTFDTNQPLLLTLVYSEVYQDYNAASDEAMNLPSFVWPGFIIFGIVVVLTFIIVLTRQGYRSYLTNRNMPLFTHPHRLSMEQVLENEHRSHIIDLILDNPRIHFNELLRATGISAGHLAWHLDILDTYKIITKQRVGQYLTYYAFLHENPLSKLDPKLQKSQTTLEILQIIRENPGIHQNEIAKVIGLKHNTVMYHLRKLQEAHVLRTEKDGRKQRFFIEPALFNDQYDENEEFRQQNSTDFG